MGKTKNTKSTTSSVTTSQNNRNYKGWKVPSVVNVQLSNAKKSRKKMSGSGSGSVSSDTPNELLDKYLIPVTEDYVTMLQCSCCNYDIKMGDPPKSYFYKPCKCGKSDEIWEKHKQECLEEYKRRRMRHDTRYLIKEMENAKVSNTNAANPLLSPRDDNADENISEECDVQQTLDDVRQRSLKSRFTKAKFLAFLKKTSSDMGKRYNKDDRMSLTQKVSAVSRSQLEYENPAFQGSEENIDNMDLGDADDEYYDYDNRSHNTEFTYAKSATSNLIYSMVSIATSIYIPIWLTLYIITLNQLIPQMKSLHFYITVAALVSTGIASYFRYVVSRKAFLKNDIYILTGAIFIDICVICLTTYLLITEIFSVAAINGFRLIITSIMVFLQFFEIIASLWYRQYLTANPPQEFARRTIFSSKGQYSVMYFGKYFKNGNNKPQHRN